MVDRYAVVWTFTDEGPVKMGNLVATGQECRFSYTAEFLHARPAAGFSLLTGPELFQDHPVVYRTSDRMPLHPRLMSLIPGDAPGNLQRRIFSELIAKQTPTPAPGFETEWELLMMAGHGGVGHIDVFRDDREADDHYSSRRPDGNMQGKRSEVWQFVREEVQQSAHHVSADSIAALLGPTPSVGGMIPKLLVSIPDSPSWDGRFSRPDTCPVGGSGCVDVILKIEPAIYQGVTDLEALCLDVHRELGFSVPRYWRAEVDGMQLLAIERFDRTEDSLPVPMESFLSVMASGSREVLGSADTDLASVGGMLEKLGTVVNLDTRAVQREVYRRFVLAYLTGNGDLHLENLSFLGGQEAVELSPVYDPAPMRAWPRHNLRSAIPIEFDPAVSVFENLLHLGRAFGLGRGDALEVWGEALEGTASYLDRVRALPGVPAERREALCKVIESERNMIGKELPLAV